MNAVVEMKQPGALASTQNSGRMAIAEIISHVSTVQEVMRAVMKENVHFGKIPGTDKPTLYKPGAEVLCMAFRIAPSYVVEDLSSPDVIRYRVTCTGTHQATGIVLGAGMGEASSSEEKYKWRKAVCKEEFDQTPAHMRRNKFGKAKGGGHYVQEQVRTEPADLANTVLKMASKRAHMAMVLNVTAASDCFAQDLEDMDDALRDHLARHGEESQDQPAEQPQWPDEVFDKQFPRFKDALAKGKPLDEIVAWAETRGKLTPAQMTKLRDAAGGQSSAPTFAQVADQIGKATDAETLAVAGDLIKSVADEKQRTELNALYDRREAELMAAN